MKMLKGILTLAMALVLAVPCFASVGYFSQYATGTDSVTMEIHSNVNGTIITNGGVTSGESATIWGHERNDYKTSTIRASTAALTTIEVSSITGFATGESIFIEDKSNVNKYEYRVITSISGAVITIPALTNAYASGSKVFEMSTIGFYRWTGTTETKVYSQTKNMISVDPGSPMAISLIAHGGTVYGSIAGYRGQ